ncbi:MAG TPA: CoA pyrophosphatase [Acidothermaceae bacterium]|jgi:8-oxo-dGTP pyrophosphatase MutT (NUDIX family)|nr:CoA pyrophosphatase [Acidothermaceae bacterium]
MTGELPEWLATLNGAAGSLQASDLSRIPPPDDGGRESAVLVLFGEGPNGPDVLLIERSGHSRQHAGQAAFPGGAVEPDDDGPVSTALREAAEETGLDPAGVEVLAVLPTLWLPPSRFLVVPVLAWWREPCAVSAVDPDEVAAVARVPVATLVDPVNRFTVRHPSGFVGDAFDIDGLLVWGFTAGLLSRLLAIGGWTLPWNTADVRELPAM